STTTTRAHVADEDRLAVGEATLPLAEDQIQGRDGRLRGPALPRRVLEDAARAVDHRHPALDRAIAREPDRAARDSGLASIDDDLRRRWKLTVERDPRVQRFDLVVKDLVQIGYYLHRAAALDRVVHDVGRDVVLWPDLAGQQRALGGPALARRVPIFRHDNAIGLFYNTPVFLRIRNFRGQLWIWAWLGDGPFCVAEQLLEAAIVGLLGELVIVDVGQRRAAGLRVIGDGRGRKIVGWAVTDLEQRDQDPDRASHEQQQREHRGGPTAGLGCQPVVVLARIFVLDLVVTRVLA